MEGQVGEPAPLTRCNACGAEFVGDDVYVTVQAFFRHHEEAHHGEPMDGVTIYQAEKGTR